MYCNFRLFEIENVNILSYITDCVQNSDTAAADLLSFCPF